MSETVSIREYARRRGVSHTAVRKAIAAGRIVPEPNGGIDPEKADLMWAARTESRQVELDGDEGGLGYRKARAYKEAYKAKLAKLEYEIKTGKLLDKNEVDVACFNWARGTRDRIQLISRRVAHRLAAETDARSVEEILDTEIREALVKLSTMPSSRIVSKIEA